MNLNPLILTNIQSSHYFKVNLYELKTYHEVIDEIYYKVSHLEPWEKGSRKTAGQTGMCGGVSMFSQKRHCSITSMSLSFFAPSRVIIDTFVDNPRLDRDNPPSRSDVFHLDRKISSALVGDSAGELSNENVYKGRQSTQC